MVWCALMNLYEIVRVHFVPDDDYNRTRVRYRPRQVQAEHRSSRREDVTKVTLNPQLVGSLILPASTCDI